MHTRVAFESLASGHAWTDKLPVSGTVLHCIYTTRHLPTQPYSDPRVTQRLKELLVNWASEFKNDSKMRYADM